jgi:hypothetical protein
VHSAENSAQSSLQGSPPHLGTKNWTSAYCDIKSVIVIDGEGILLSPSIGMLNRTGTAEGNL